MIIQREEALMVQVAELDTVPETIEATLNYFVDTGAVPVTLVGAPGATDLRTDGGESDPRRVALRNGRPSADSFQLERDGFRFVPHDTKVADFYDEDEIRRVYYPEMEALVKAESGASRVVVFDHTLRTPNVELREAAKIREVVRRVHNDYTEWSARAHPIAGRGRRAVAASLCDHPSVAADPPSGRDVAAGDRRCAEPIALRYGGDRAPLSGPHRPDLGDHLQPRPPLVLVPAHAAGRGAGLQGV
jgi:hypothetical protein